MSKLNLVLSMVGPALIVVLLGILVQRRLYKRFPVFFVYCISILIVTFLRFLVVGHPISYFLVYWTTEACYILIAFCAMLSVLRPLTPLYYVRHPWSRFVFLPGLLLIVWASLWLVFVRPIDKSAIGRFASGVYAFVILMSLAEFVLFLATYRVHGRYLIQWTQYEFGILGGFGVLAFLNEVAYSALVLQLFHVKPSPQLESVFQFVPLGAFIGSATVWLISFWRPEVIAGPPGDIGKLRNALRVLKEELEFVRSLKHLMVNWVTVFRQPS